MLVAALGLSLAPAAVAAAPASGICIVCQVTRGEEEAEPFKATRAYEGKTYGFCSEKCAKAFEADPVAYLPPTLPRPAPAFALTDLSGRAVSNASLAGKVVLLDFWATWCVPCRKAIPELQALHRKYSDLGFTVVGISIDEGGDAKVKAFVAAKKLGYPIAVDAAASPAWAAFRVKAVPASYLIDREGRVVAQWTGRSASGAEIEKTLEGLLETR